MSQAPLRAALFDMDRTLVRKETATLYVKYQVEIGEATLLDLAKTLYWVGQYTLGIIDAEKVAAKAALALAGHPEATMSARCDDWFVKYVKPHVTLAGREAVRGHKEKGHVCAIVTGSTRYAARPLARMLDIDHVVSSELEIDEGGRFTGRALMPLCLGRGKVQRAEELARRLGFSLEHATFYSDSVSDLPLLERVAEPVVVNPDPRLARIAKKRGWRVERW